MSRKGQKTFPPCGTSAGYRAHIKYGPPPCDECRKANATKTAERRAQMIDCPDCGRRMALYCTYRCCTCYKRYLKARPKRRKVKRAPLIVEGSDD